MRLFMLAASAAVTGPLLAQNCIQQELAPQPSFNAEYGFSVAIGNGHAVAGAPGADEAHVYLRQGSGFTYWQTLTPQTPGGAPGFGYSVDIDGEWLAVSSRASDLVEVYREAPGSGQFVYVATLIGSEITPGEAFGQDVTIEGSELFVGASSDDPSGNNSGAVYVFEVDPAGSWSETQRLAAPDGAAGDLFGVAIDADGPRLVVGSLFDDDLGQDSGSAYLFEFSPLQGWTFTNKLNANDGAPSDFFGVSVAIDGDRVVVGAEGDDDNGQFSGSAYTFRPAGLGAWTQEAKLLAPDGFTNDDFGFAMSTSGDLVDVAARAHQSAGAVYRFDLTGGVATPIAKFMSVSPTPGETFGSAVDMADDGTFANVIGSAGHSAPGALISGAIYFPVFSPGGFLDCNGNLVDDACDLALGVATDINQNGVLDECEAIGSVYCTPNAANSTGTWAKMIATGSLTVSENDFTILVSDLPANSAGYFFTGGHIGFVAFPGNSQGIMCLIGGVSRFGLVQLAGANGTFDYDVDLLNYAGTGPVAPGETWYIQTWYRDANPTPTSNFSDAVEVTFQ